MLGRFTRWIEGGKNRNDKNWQSAIQEIFYPKGWVDSSADESHVNGDARQLAIVDADNA